MAGAALRGLGGDFYNPDEATRRYLEHGLSPLQANSRAWQRGRDALEAAIRDGTSYSFETTLGGRTMTALLLDAAATGHAVHIFYVGLSTPERHIRRVKSRVERGGHDIPARKIRERYDASRRNLIRLIPHIEELRLFDNSAEADPADGLPPAPALLLHIRSGRIRLVAPVDELPDWAKPIVAAAVRAYGEK